MSNLTKDLPVIDSESWSDLREGEKALVRGHFTAKRGATSIMITQPDWSSILVHLTDVDGIQPYDIQSSRVHICVERTEDGLRASISDITFVG